MRGMKWLHGAPLALGAVLRLAVALGIYASLVLTNVQGQGAGFQSIDCGATATSTQNSTNITWVPDGSFVSTGKNANVSNTTNSIKPPFDTLRYFPGKQTKNCYTLPVKANMTYLVRAGFLFGNYSRSTSNKLPSFVLLFDATHWADISISGVNDTIYHEIIVAAMGSNFSVCLARNGTLGSDPFISSLEIRPVSGDPNMYSPVHRNSFLYTNSRINFGINDSTTPPVRYPDDDYDRIWDSDSAKITNIDSYSANSTNHSVSSILTFDQPPSLVMQTARSVNKSTNMSFNFMLRFGPGNYYLALYFAEFQINDSNSSSEHRMFDIYVNQDLFSKGLDVYQVNRNFNTVEVYTQNESFSGQSYLLELVPSGDSTLGPILNAAESYLVREVHMGTDAQDVRALVDIQRNFNLRSWGGDPCLPASYSWSWLNCSNASPPRVTALLLSNMSLNGTIPDSIANLTELTDLDLHDNHLVGNIPTSLVNLLNLKLMDLRNNNLSGVLPEGFSNVNISASGNPFLCEPSENSFCGSSPAPAPTLATGSKEKHKGLTIGLVIAGLVMLVVTALGIVCYRCKRRGKGNFLMANSGHWPPVPPFTEALQSAAPVTDFWKEGMNDVNNYSFAEMRTMTNDFERKIGEGCFGHVFYGMLPDGQKVVVKLLQSKFQQLTSGFLNEVGLLSSVHHKNLLRLGGFCAEYHRQMLVYDYMPKGSLYDHLYGPNAVHEFLDWRARLSIIQQVAQGLEHLHAACAPSIIHGNMKSTNVLLSDKMVAKVTDFGLYKLAPDGFGTVDGTSGYLDPEYFMVNKLTDKSDVYSFGVLLLEVVSGRAPLDTSLPKEQWTIADWARRLCQEGNCELVADPSLHGSYNVNAMSKVVQVGLRTVEPNMTTRPTMSEIVIELKEAAKIELGHHVAFAESIISYSSSTKSSSFPSTSPNDSCIDDNT